VAATVHAAITWIANLRSSWHNKRNEIKRGMMLQLVIGYRKATRERERERERGGGKKDRRRMTAGRESRFTDSAVKEDNRGESKQEEITRAHISPSNRRRGDKVNSRLPTCVRPFEVLPHRAPYAPCVHTRVRTRVNAGGSGSSLLNNNERIYPRQVRARRYIKILESEKLAR